MASNEKNGIIMHRRKWNDGYIYQKLRNFDMVHIEDINY